MGVFGVGTKVLQLTLPPTNEALVGRCLEDQFPFDVDPVRCHVSGKEGKSTPSRSDCSVSPL